MSTHPRSIRRNLSRREHRARRPLAVLAVVLLVATACGARLTKAQMAALDSQNGGYNQTSSNNGVASGPAGGGQPSGSGVVANPTGGAKSGGTGGSTRTGTGGGGVAGGGGTGNSSGTGPQAGGGGGGGGGGTVIQAGNPLAGPGGKVCAAGAAGSGPGVTASTITVGNIATVNGPVPGLFAGARYGAQAVADYINSLGGICGRQLRVNSADDQFDQATDQQEAASMSNSVLAFMGSFSLQDAGIPAGAPSVPDLGESLSSQRFNSPQNYSPQPEAPGYNEGEYVYMKSLPQYAAASQHMAILAENTPATANTGKWEEAALEAAGYKFIFKDFTLQPTDPTFNGDVQKMKSAGVQGVIFQGTGTIIGQLANAMYADGMKVVFGNYCPSAYDPSYLSNAGPGTAGTILSQSLALYDGEDASAIPMVATLDQWYSRVNPGQVPDIYAAYAWMSGLMLAQALNESGNVSRAGLATGLKTLTSFTGDGLSAPSNPVGKTPPNCYVMIVVVNGKFARAPQTPSGFRCTDAAYYHYPGS
ncbi:MAG TPA: ABC transporter substrate-binding protein [Acidimicrobiales bacterium]|nr:ABC transporter substrate-binding protein [Acidimicrobiales bacterium]